MPGGKVEAGETLAEAVVRELAEETGIEGVCGELIDWVERIEVDHHFIIFDFAVHVLAPADDPRPGDDAAEAAWVALEEVAGLNLVDGLAELLHDASILEVIV